MSIKRIILKEMDGLEWMDDIELIIPFKDGEYPTIGQTVYCIDGFDNKDIGHSKTPGGGGYVPDKEVIVKKVTEIRGYDYVIVWPKDGGHGIYSNALGYKMD